MIPNWMTLTQTVVTLSANTDAPLIAANKNRVFLAISNVGTGLCNLSFTANAAVVGQGWPLGAAPASGDQGGALVFDGHAVPKGPVRGISQVGTTVVVLEGV